MKKTISSVGAALVLTVVLNQMGLVSLPVQLLLIVVAAGALVGLTARLPHNFCVWLSTGFLAMTAIGVGLSRWVLVIDPMRDSGTIPLPAPFGIVLASVALSTFMIGPLVLGVVVGLGFRFRNDNFGWIRFGLCTVTCVIALAFAPWIVGVAFD